MPQSEKVSRKRSEMDFQNLMGLSQFTFDLSSKKFSGKKRQEKEINAIREPPHF